MFRSHKTSRGIVASVVLTSSSIFADYGAQSTPPGMVFKDLSNTSYSSASAACNGSMPGSAGDPDIVYSNPRAGFDGDQPSCRYTVNNHGNESEFNGLNWYSILFQCGAGTVLLDGNCVGGRPARDSECPMGNPTMPGRGSKVQVETDFTVRNGFGNSLSLVRKYGSWSLFKKDNRIGKSWSLEPFGRRLGFSVEGGNDVILARRGPGDVQRFTLVSGAYEPESFNADSVTFDSAAQEWVYTDYDAVTTERYTVNGALSSITKRSGETLTLAYSDASTPIAAAPEPGLLISVTDPFANSINFVYNADSLITEAHSPTGESITYSYDVDGYLLSAAHSDGSIRQYHYEPALGPQWIGDDGTATGGSTLYGLGATDTYNLIVAISGLTNVDEVYIGSGPQPNYVENIAGEYALRPLTGITDENGIRLSSYHYNDDGRVTRSVRNDGTSDHLFSYPNDTTTVVTNPLGKQTTYHYTVIEGVRRVSEVEGHPTANCAGANRFYTYDSNGYVETETDWKGNQTHYLRDSLGNEIQRIEAFGTSAARTFTTDWHPSLRLPTKITEPNRVIEYTYDDVGNVLTRVESQRP